MMARFVLGAEQGAHNNVCALGACEHSLWHLQGLHWIVVCEPQPSKTKNIGDELGIFTLGSTVILILDRN